MTTKPCSQCGLCCLKLGNSIMASEEDVERWEEEGREDILKYVDNVGTEEHPIYDLWIREDGEELKRCPFVRKIPKTNKYLCRIHDTKPRCCKNYTPWAPGTICEDRD